MKLTILNESGHTSLELNSEGAIEQIHYGLEKANNKGYMEEWQKSLESKENLLNLQEELNKSKGIYDSLNIEESRAF